MEPQSDQPPLIAIVGETAAGKSALALELAERFHGEIIAADSRTVYKGLDIGTAKPTLSDRKRVPHHLLDVVMPDYTFTVADFKVQAEAAIQNIIARGKVPFLVGGTGLYIDAVLYNFSFRKPASNDQRAALQQLTIEALQERLTSQGLPLPKDPQNPRHLVRAIETQGETSERAPLRPRTLLLGLQIEREQLLQRITHRVETMVEQGLVAELQSLAVRYGWEVPALQSTSYKAFRESIEGRLTLEEAERLCIRNDMQLAKRQRTWFKRNKDIQWICKKEEAVDLITTFLNK